jgi:putative Ca2+/H+ antiporter (TMEM165/GDT1 family)
VEAFLISTLLVAIAEIGDKTQLLALVLAVRFRRPVPIVLGIFVSTVLNHAAAGVAGSWVASLLGPEGLRWTVGILFLAMAGWALVPDRIDDEDAAPARRYGPFLATLIGFFLAEMGDKTQIATVALAARYHPLWAVIVGTTVGMMAANVPAVLLGHFAGHRIRVEWVRYAAAAFFAALGIASLVMPPG